MRILIIEDDIDAAGAMSHGLTEAGYECVHAADGELGLKEAGKGGFDVLIVDRMMPKKDGVEVTWVLPFVPRTQRTWPGKAPSIVCVL